MALRADHRAVGGQLPDHRVAAPQLADHWQKEEGATERPREDDLERVVVLKVVALVQEHRLQFLVAEDLHQARAQADAWPREAVAKRVRRLGANHIDAVCQPKLLGQGRNTLRQALPTGRSMRR